MYLTGKHPSGICVKENLTGIGGGPPVVIGGGPVSISASVGNRGTNVPTDTSSVQDALNRVPAGQGQATPALKVDGLCGGKTIHAIQKFQLHHFGWGGADGLVEPERQTHQKLNELLAVGMPAKANGSNGSAADTVVLPDLSEGFRRAKLYIQAARRNLSSASVWLDKTDDSDGRFQVFSREFRMQALNNNFDIDKLPVSIRFKFFDVIWGVFQRMEKVFQRPGGLWGTATFEPDYTGDKNLAFTNFGGYFREGQFRFTNKGHRIRLDTIYICAPFLNHVGNIDNQALIHIHELAHFVGNPEFIDDHAYNFQENGQKLKRLPPQLKLLTAESYSNFAWEAAHPGGSPPPI